MRPTRSIKFFIIATVLFAMLTLVPKYRTSAMLPANFPHQGQVDDVEPGV